MNLRFERKLSEREVCGLLCCLDSERRLLVLCESVSDGSRLLHAEVERLVLALAVGLAQCITLVLVVDSECACDRLADDSDLCELGWAA